MDQQTDIYQMLNLMERPAFCVENGIITKANQAAHALMIPEGEPVSSVIKSNLSDYLAFCQGYLYLSVTVENSSYETQVTEINGRHIFVIDTEQPPELKVLALASKELREPLTTLTSTANQLSQLLKSNPDAKKYLAQENRSIYQLLRTVANMSDAGTSQSSKMELQDITSVFQEIFDRASEYCVSLGITLSFINLSRELYTLIDRQVLERGIYNMLSNAMKYTPAGGTIQARLSLYRSSIHLTVKDSGIGISAQKTGTLFTRYLREPGFEDVRNGLGLGMTLIRNAALIHGGTLLVQENDGLTVTMHFPVCQTNSRMRSPTIFIDYTGERDHSLVEFSDLLPSSYYDPDKL